MIEKIRLNIRVKTNDILEIPIKLKMNRSIKAKV